MKKEDVVEKCTDLAFNKFDEIIDMVNDYVNDNTKHEYGSKKHSKIVDEILCIFAQGINEHPLIKRNR